MNKSCLRLSLPKSSLCSASTCIIFGFIQSSFQPHFRLTALAMCSPMFISHLHGRFMAHSSPASSNFNHLIDSSSIPVRTSHELRMLNSITIVTWWYAAARGVFVPSYGLFQAWLERFWCSYLDLNLAPVPIELGGRAPVQTCFRSDWRVKPRPNKSGVRLVTSRRAIIWCLIWGRISFCAVSAYRLAFKACSNFLLDEIGRVRKASEFFLMCRWKYCRRVSFCTNRSYIGSKAYHFALVWAQASRS